MSAVVDKTCNVIFGHFRELLLEQAFEARKNDPAVSGAVIVDNSKFNLAISFFYNCRLS
jgi:hypothetical protein